MVTARAIGRVLVLTVVAAFIAPVGTGAVSLAPSVGPAAAADAVSLLACNDVAPTQEIVIPDPVRRGHVLTVHVLCDGPVADEATDVDCTSPAFGLLWWHWEAPMAALVDAQRSGLDADGVRAAFDLSALAWDAITVTPLWGGATLGGDASALGRLDGTNQFGWKRLPPGVIAVTYTWSHGGVAYESDAAYNTRFTWSLTGAANAMDLQNIATHELGHSFGLGHPVSTPANACLTMYAYADYGETQKRTLGLGDIVGARRHYV